jgi:menaquinone-dependent protoporphyrinogen oxidase
VKTLIAYSTKYGCTEKCAKEISQGLKGDVATVNLKTNKQPDISEFDMIVLGGSIYAGRIRKELQNFVSANLEALLEKNVALFVCGMQEGEESIKELNNAFPESLRKKAIMKEFFGGEFIFSKMKFLDKAIAKKVSGMETDISHLDKEKIRSFIDMLNKI